MRSTERRPEVRLLHPHERVLGAAPAPPRRGGRVSRAAVALVFTVSHNDYSDPITCMWENSAKKAHPWTSPSLRQAWRVAVQHAAWHAPCVDAGFPGGTGGGVHAKVMGRHVFVRRLRSVCVCSARVCTHPDPVLSSFENAAYPCSQMVGMGWF